MSPIPDIDPSAWHPPKAPGLKGPFQKNSNLVVEERWLTDGQGPEDVAVDASGNAYAGLEDGRIVRFGPEGGDPVVVAETGGRPLGIEVDSEERLVVCDADKGLLRIDEGIVETLVAAFEGVPLKFCNNAAIGADGTIYFSDTSTSYGIADYRLDIAEHRPTGRLFAYDPATGKTQKVLDGLYFANGVALAEDESFVLVAETGAYRITRLWLSGDLAGQSDTFIDNLPGFPDNLSRGTDGTFWVAMPTPRDKALDLLMRLPKLRRLVLGLPERLQPQPARFGFVLGLDRHGNVTHNLQDPSGSFAMVTGVREHDGWLYLGSLIERAVGRARLPSVS